MSADFPSQPPEIQGKQIENINNDLNNNNNNENKIIDYDENKPINRNERIKRKPPLKINGRINNHETVIVIDTGAAVSVIEYDFYQLIPSKLPIVKINKTITDAQNNHIDVVGQISAFISIGLTKF